MIFDAWEAFWSSQEAKMGLAGESYPKIKDAIWVLGSNPFVWDFLKYSLLSPISRMGTTWQLRVIFLENLRHLRNQPKSWFFHAWEAFWSSQEAKMGLGGKSCPKIQDAIWVLRSNPFVWDFLKHFFPSWTSQIWPTWKLRAIILENLRNPPKSWFSMPEMPSRAPRTQKMGLRGKSCPKI